MRQAILDFLKQFLWEPKIENEERLPKVRHFIVAGMGGSALAADLLRLWDPKLDVITHRNYGLPANLQTKLARGESDVLIIASSYSGNTEETLDVYLTAKQNGFPLAAVTTGGKLLDLAKKDGLPYIQLPDTGIQPRSALGFSLKALVKIMGEEAKLKELSGFGESFKNLGAEYFEEPGKKLAEQLRGYVPLIYSSERNFPVVYNWKIKFNETGKIPAFCNFFPELNHNEMTGFDYTLESGGLSEKFFFIFLKDDDDHPRVVKRMEVLGDLLTGRGFQVKILKLEGVNILHKIFSSLLLADWASYYTALQYGADPERVPMVEEFKKLIR